MWWRRGSWAGWALAAIGALGGCGDAASSRSGGGSGGRTTDPGSAGAMSGGTPAFGGEGGAPISRSGAGGAPAVPSSGGGGGTAGAGGCRAHSDCLTEEFCEAGICVADRCVTGQSSCDQGQLVSCPEPGAGIVVTGCDARQTCVAEGDSAQCRDWVCDPAQRFCEAAGEQLLECSTDGLSSTPVEDCALSGGVCVGGACVSVICTAGTQYCSDSEARQCSTKGDAYSIIDTCASTEYCDASAGVAACHPRVCDPDQPTCNGFEATTCNALGSDYSTGGVDCAATLQACSAGTCVPRACDPGIKRCDGNRIVQCNADALTTSVLNTCFSGYYCDPPSATCKPQVCSPSNAVCDKTVATTCNALGNGYESGGTDCAPNYCRNGACVSALFFEDFEDGDISNWFVPAPTAQDHVTATLVNVGTESTQHSLNLTQTLGSFAYGGAGYTFNPRINPTYVSWWMRAGQSNKWACFFQLLTTTGSGELFLLYFDGRSQGAITWPWRSDFVFGYSAGRWYHFELRNLDWTARTYDFYIDGTLRASALPLGTVGNAFGYLNFYNYDEGSSCNLDQVLMQ